MNVVVNVGMILKSLCSLFLEEEENVVLVFILLRNILKIYI
jgi:hypothetical protein